MSPGEVLFAFIVAAGVNLFYYIRVKHLEQIAKIEHGYDIEKNSNKVVFRNLGLVCGLLSAGLFTAYFLAETFNLPMPIMLLGSELLAASLAFSFIYALRK